MVKHVQDATSHQDPDDIEIKEGWRDLGEIDELFEKRGQRKMKPRIKLLLSKIGSFVGLLFKSQRLVVYQKDGNTI